MVIRTLDSPAMSTMLFMFVFPEILVLVLLPMLIDYSTSCTRARSLGTVTKIKMMREPSLIFIDLWFGIYVLFMRLPSRKYKKKCFEDLDDLLVFLDFTL
jgi:hypothetical protein